MKRKKQVRLCALIGICAMLSACSSVNLNYKTDRRADRPKERLLSTLAVTDMEGTPRKLNFYKVHKGYALKANLEKKKKQSTDMMLSKDKEYDWFAGLKWSWDF